MAGCHKAVEWPNGFCSGSGDTPTYTHTHTHTNTQIHTHPPTNKQADARGFAQTDAEPVFPGSV